MPARSRSETSHAKSGCKGTTFFAIVNTDIIFVFRFREIFITINLIGCPIVQGGFSLLFLLKARGKGQECRGLVVSLWLQLNY